jgi:hypothetical protein
LWLVKNKQFQLPTLILRISLIVTGCFGHRDRFAAALDTG